MSTRQKPCLFRPALRRGRGVLATFIVALLVVGSAGSVPPAGSDVERRPPVFDQYIVTLNGDDKPEEVAADHLAEHGGWLLHTYSSALRGYAASFPASAIRSLRRDPRVRRVEGDQSVSVAEALPTGVDRVEADVSATAGIDGVDRRVNADVAILDTGIAKKHDDLVVAGGKSCITGSAWQSDPHGHGTHVAGIVGARDNGVGVVGVAPGTRLWSVQVLDAGGFGKWSSVICGIDWVTKNSQRIEVANLSFGGDGVNGPCSATALHDAICRSVAAGVTYVAAAGNRAAPVDIVVPAAFPEVITVSALADFDGKAGEAAAPQCGSDQDDTYADFSNYGSAVDLIAPGVCITSTARTGGYSMMSGTSMAAPHVTGAAALILTRQHHKRPASVRADLQAAGTFRWKTSTDKDGTVDKLLDVSSF